MRLFFIRLLSECSRSEMMTFIINIDNYEDDCHYYQLI